MVLIAPILFFDEEGSESHPRIMGMANQVTPDTGQMRW